MAYLSERPTAEQWRMAAWMFIVVFATIGTVGLWYGFRAPPNQVEIARQLIWVGMWAWAAANATWGFKRGVEWFVG
jgi:hypothetical protein